MKFLTPLLILAAPSLAGAQEKLSLSLDWKPGKTYLEKIDLSQVVGIPRHGEAKAKTHLEVSLAAAKGAPTSLQIGFEALRILVDPPAPASNLSFDSALPKEGNQDIAQFFTNLHKQHPKLLLTDRGSVKGMSSLEALATQNPLLGRFLGKEQLANLMQQGWLVTLPEKPVSKGDSWPYQLKFPTPVGPLALSGTYTLGGTVTHESRQLVEILMKGQVQGDFTKPDPQEKDEEVLRLQGMMLMMGVKVKESTVTGTLWYDPAVNLLVSSQVDTNIRLSVAKYPENGQPTEIPLQQSMTLNLQAAP